MPDRELASRALAGGRREHFGSLAQGNGVNHPN